MYKIIDDRGTGKTSRLMLLAKEHNGIVVCGKPERMIEKAYTYGLNDIQFVSYTDYLKDPNCYDKPVFIDELDTFLKILNSEIVGYTVSKN